jgi:hypothetical protein
MPTRDEIQAMTPEEINELWDKGVLQDGLRTGKI